MANIIEDLKRILSARYGKDVRQSIHDSISDINEESTEAKAAAITAQNSAVRSAEQAGHAAQQAQYWAKQAEASSGLVIDDQMSETSLNPVQNKVITKGLYEASHVWDETRGNDISLKLKKDESIIITVFDKYGDDIERLANFSIVNGKGYSVTENTWTAVGTEIVVPDEAIYVIKTTTSNAIVSVKYKVPVGDQVTAINNDLSQLKSAINNTASHWTPINCNVNGDRCIYVKRGSLLVVYIGIVTTSPLNERAEIDICTDVKATFGFEALNVLVSQSFNVDGGLDGRAFSNNNRIALRNTSTVAIPSGTTLFTTLIIPQN